MKNRIAMTIALAATAFASAANAADLTVFKSAACGCCAKWVQHLEKAGHDVKVVNQDDMRATKKKHGIPDKLASCHTAIVDGYVVEGHVPVADIERLLKQKPNARGIAVPGMPMGSPGMEHGNHREPYQTYLIGKDGKVSVFARH